MNDIAIRLQCIDAAGGDLGLAKEIFQWVMGRVDPPTAPYPYPGSASDIAGPRNIGVNIGIPVSSGGVSAPR